MPTGVSVEDCRDLIALKPPRLCSAESAVELAEELARRMPTGPDTNKQDWIADMTVVFSNYAETDVRIAVTHPMEGLRATRKWLPDLPEVIAFLDAMAVRRARIVSNAKRVVVAHDQRVADDRFKPVDAKRLVDLSRKLKGLCSVDELHARQTAQTETNDYARHLGEGDIAKGFEIMIEQGIDAPPPNWRQP